MMTVKICRSGLAVVLIAALAACMGAAPENDGDKTSADRAPTSGEETMSISNERKMSLEAAVDAARQDLARRHEVSADAVRVLDARAITWANGALGCPQEGMMYTQALVRGYYILLGSGSSEFAYHAGADGKPFYCPAERSRGPKAGIDPQS